MRARRRIAPSLVLCACATKQPHAPVPVATSPVATRSPAGPAAAPVVVATPTPASERCLTGPAGRLELLPRQAIIVGAADLPAVLSSRLFLDNRAKLETAETRALIDGAIACGLGVDRWRRVTLGIDNDAKQIAAVLTVDGIGEADRLACVGDAITRQRGEAPWQRVARDGPPKYTSADGGAAWVVDDCTAVIVTAKWVEPVELLLAGTGTSVRGGPLEPAIGRTAVTRDVWFASALTPALVAGSFLADVRDVGGSIELAEGLALVTSLRFDDASIATTKSNELRTQVSAMGGMITAMGVPQRVLDRVQIGTHGATVTFAVSLSDAELAEIRNHGAK